MHQQKKTKFYRFLSDMNKEYSTVLFCLENNTVKM